MRLDDILERVSGYAPDADTEVIIQAYFYAAKAHDRQQRKSGEAYFTHPVAWLEFSRNADGCGHHCHGCSMTL